MTSVQKDSKRSSKFNYLTVNNTKQELLGRYETVNFQPSMYKKNYGKISVDRNKQNQKENVNQDFIDESKYQTRNDRKQNNKKNESTNDKLTNFRKNKIKEDNQINYKQNQNATFQKRKQKVNNQDIQRLRNKSFGNISIKKSQLENSRCINHKKNIGQFSPYQQQKKLKQIRFEDVSNNYKSADLCRFSPNPYPKTQQKLLIYELQEQQSIIKKQLKQFQYQNQLLRKKIEYLEDDNIVLKQQNQQYKNQFQQQETYYQQLLDTQSINISQLHQQVQQMSTKIKQYETTINQDKFFIKDLQNQIQKLDSNAKEMEMLLDSKQQIIQQLNTKIELFNMGSRENKFCETNLSKRRKSLDFSTLVKRLPVQEYSINNSHLNQQNQFTSEQEKKDYQRSLNTSSIEKIMNKSLIPYGKIQSNKHLEKQINFIQSIKSMYFKITNKQVKDLKQLWKWLKLIAHECQSFSQLYNFKDSILAVLDDLQTRNCQQESEKQLSFMEKECYKVIKKLGEIVSKCHY